MFSLLIEQNSILEYSLVSLFMKLNILQSLEVFAAKLTGKPALAAQMFPSCPAMTAFLITLVEISWSST